KLSASETAGQGTVGTWPASSCASRAALSLASCAGSSLGTNLPCVVDGAVGLGLAAVVVAALATIALPLVTAAPITPPTSIEAAIAPPASAVLSRIMVFTSFFALAQTGHLARSCRGALKARCQEPVNLARTGSRLLWTRGQASAGGSEPNVFPVSSTGSKLIQRFRAQSQSNDLDTLGRQCSPGPLHELFTDRSYLRRSGSESPARGTGGKHRLRPLGDRLQQS